MPSFSRGGKGPEAVALTACYKQLHENSGSPAAWLQHARQFLISGDLDRCRLLLETLLHEAPTDVQAHLMLGEVALRSGPGSYDEAVAACRHAHKLAGDQDVTLQCRTSCSLAVALATKARMPSIAPEHRTELREAAVGVMQACVDSCPDPHLGATLSYNLAVTSAELGMLGPALRHAHAALTAAEKLPASAGLAAAEKLPASASSAEEPLLPACVLLVAVLLTARQQLPAASAVLGLLDQPAAGITAADGYKMTQEQQVLAAQVQAGALSAQGDHTAAVAVLTHCRKTLAGSAATAPITAKVSQELTHACARAGAVADACYCAEQALQVEPWSAASHSAAGSAHEAAGRHLAALESYGTALSLDPHHAYALLRQGALIAKAGTLTQLSAARDLLGEGLRMDPSNAAGWYQLGLACKAMQHATAAEKYLRTAMLLAASAPVVPFSNLSLSYPAQTST